MSKKEKADVNERKKKKRSMTITIFMMMMMILVIRMIMIFKKFGDTHQRTLRLKNSEDLQITIFIYSLAYV